MIGCVWISVGLNGGCEMRKGKWIYDSRGERKTESALIPSRDHPVGRERGCIGREHRHRSAIGTNSGICQKVGEGMYGFVDVSP